MDIHKKQVIIILILAFTSNLASLEAFAWGPGQYGSEPDKRVTSGVESWQSPQQMYAQAPVPEIPKFYSTNLPAITKELNKDYQPSFMATEKLPTESLKKADVPQTTNDSILRNQDHNTGIIELNKTAKDDKVPVEKTPKKIEAPGLVKFSGKQEFSLGTDHKVSMLIEEFKLANKRLNQAALTPVTDLEISLAKVMNKNTDELRQGNVDEFNKTKARINSELKMIGQGAVRELIVVLQDRTQDARTRQWAAEALGEIGPVAKDAVPALVEALKDGRLYLLAVKALGNIGPQAQQAIPALSDLLKNMDQHGTNQVKETIVALVKIKPDEKQTTLVLAERLRSDECETSGVVERALMESGANAVPALVEALKGGDIETRKKIMYLIGKLGADAKSAVPALVNILRNDKDGDARLSAVNALGDIGPGAKDAAPVLFEMMLMMRQESSLVEISAAVFEVRALEALKKMGSAAVQVLIGALKSEDAGFRTYAACMIKHFGPDAKDAVPGLIGLLQDKDINARKAAVLALGSVGPGAKDAVPALLGALKEEDKSFVYIVIIALGDIGPGAKDALPALVKIANSGDQHFTLATEYAIKKISKK